VEVKRGAPGGEAVLDFERSPTWHEGRGLFACGRGEGKRWGLDFFFFATGVLLCHGGLPAEHNSPQNHPKYHLGG